jgi:SAM-dependent methyltransferase
VSRQDRERLRATFAEVAELYDRARPLYPGSVFDDLVEFGRLGERARVLEIGCGTGQATLPLAQRGFDLTSIELGKQLADVARRKLAGYANVEIVVADFETWQPKAERFDAVVAFTAFHWIDPDVRYEKSASVLRKGSALAVVSTQHVWPEESDPFWAEVQEDYDAVAPDPANSAPPRSDAVADLTDEIDASERFENVVVRRYLWEVSYTSAEYINVLDTYSGHRALANATRNALYDRIRRRIESRPDKTVRKTYLATLNVARRL